MRRKYIPMGKYHGLFGVALFCFGNFGASSRQPVEFSIHSAGSRHVGRKLQPFGEGRRVRHMFWKSLFYDGSFQA